jgi:hypothetical protein
MRGIQVRGYTECHSENTCRSATLNRHVWRAGTQLFVFSSPEDPSCTCHVGCDKKGILKECADYMAPIQGLVSLGFPDVNEVQGGTSGTFSKPVTSLRGSSRL